MIIATSLKKINMVVSCGCSWMDGSGCYNRLDNRLSKLFANHFHTKDINLSREGGSNDRILRKVIDWAVKNKDKLSNTFFLIGLTEPVRYEIWNDEVKKYCQGNATTVGVGKIPRLGYVENKFEEMYAVTYQSDNVDIDRTMRNIISLTGVLNKYKCNYLIFDTIGDIKKISKGHKYFDEVFNDKYFYTEQTWDEFCSPRGSGLYAAECEFLDNDDWGHPSIKSNKLWYETLLRYYEDIDVSK